ncbi:c-type cytochrome [Vitellibacter sp. q18]|jgi:hypothetical protein|nr:c-type cytochrome [Aequorivita lutea]
MKLKKILLSLFSMSAIVTLAVSFYAFKSNSEYGYMAQPPWENLKVLPNDISKDSLIGLMKNYETALGVECNYCHVPKKDDPSKLDFPNDALIEKEIARGMIAMTNEINENYFKPYFPDPKPEQVHVVNCVLCHRGTANPEKYLAKMHLMYKTYDPERDNRKEKALEKQKKQ